jgi:hypothetical protein
MEKQAILVSNSLMFSSYAEAQASAFFVLRRRRQNSLARPATNVIIGLT